MKKTLIPLILLALLFQACSEQKTTPTATEQSPEAAPETSQEVSSQPTDAALAEQEPDSSLAQVSDALTLGDGQVSIDGNSVAITNQPGQNTSLRWPQNIPVPAEAALAFSVRIDPISDDNIQRADVDAGIVIGMPSPQSDPNRFAELNDKVLLEFKEFGDRTRFTIIMDGQEISFWDKLRMGGGKGLPNVGTRQPGDTYLLKIVAIPRGDKTELRFFVEHGDRPLRLFNYDVNHFVQAWTLDRPLTEINYVGLYSRDAGKITEPVTTLFEDIRIESIPQEAAESWMAMADFVMTNLNYDYPGMEAIKAAKEAGEMEEARRLFIEYWRTRELPAGPEYDMQMARATAHGKEANWKEVSDNALKGIYGKGSWFHQFSEPGELSRENGMPNWVLDPGFLNRHFHWVVMTYAWERTEDPRYVARVGDELIDYLEQEPIINFNTAGLGGMASMDGSVISEHILWTGNIGRRLEMTWWQVFEVMRKTEHFSDAAIFAFLDGVIRQCRLLTNPSVFLEWDDSGLHGAMALVKSSILFPMADEAPLWAEIGWDRINEIVNVQFHPDGSHVSLSTGYEWATIGGFEKFYDYIVKNGGDVPPAMEELIEEMYYKPLAITRPGFGTIDLNDGMWSDMTDRAKKAHGFFPDREDYLFFATKGEEGKAPEPLSMYFPNAGQYVFRTGWGPDEQYLFFGAGPWGASHGKQDALNIYTAYGSTLLLGNSGRAAYSGVGNTPHAGRSLAFNVLSPDWAQENSIPHWKQDKNIGFNPPKRRFVNNDDYDYGEGAFSYGWHKPGEHIKGKWVRQVLFIKGEQPKDTGYYVVIDTVEPETDRETTWRLPWHFWPEQVSIDEKTKMSMAKNGDVQINILPVDPEDNMSLSIIKGQEKPELLGWRIYGEDERPFPTPTYAWPANDTFTKAWVIQMQHSPDAMPVKSVKVVPTETPGEIMFQVMRQDGGTDSIIRRFPGSGPTEFNGKTIEGDVAVISRDATNELISMLEMTDGQDSVAAARGTPIAKAQPNLSDTFAKVETAPISSQIGVSNASFEEPRLEVETGAVQDWESNSLAGTGTWPVSRANVEGQADGDQAVVIAPGGTVGQLLKGPDGKPVRIAPGSTLKVSFVNLPHKETDAVNLGIYIAAGKKDGPPIAEAIPFRTDEAKTPGRKTFSFQIASVEHFDKSLAEGWEKIPMYLLFRNFAGRVVLDDIQVSVEPANT